MTYLPDTARPNSRGRKGVVAGAVAGLAEAAFRALAGWTRPSTDRDGAADALTRELEFLLPPALRSEDKQGSVAFVGAGPGDAELLTRKAHRLLTEADVVIHDRLVSDEILALLPRRARRIAAGKTGFGPSAAQEDINAEIVAQARAGARVVRLKGGDAAVFGRLDEETAACREAGIAYTVVPGITAASASAASIGQSLTRRGRNSSLRFVTGHDMNGFAEQDWRAMGAPGAVTAIYMGKKSARFVQGRMLMHGAAPDTPITLIENASRPDERVFGTCLARLAQCLEDAGSGAPCLLLVGLAPTAEKTALRRLTEIAL